MSTNRSFRRQACRRQPVESLETRRLLSIAPVAIPEVFVVTGTDGDDTIGVSPSADGSQVVVTLNGTATSRDAGGVQRVDVSGLAGNDVLTVSPALGVPVAFDGGAGTDELRVTGTSGDDTFDLAPTQLSLNGRAAATYTNTVEQVRLDGSSGDDRANAPPDSVRGPHFIFDGGAGADRLVVLPPASSAPPSYTYVIGPGTVQGIRNQLVWADYSPAVELVDVFGAHLQDRFSVLGTSAGTSVMLHGGEGRDTLAGSVFTTQNPRLDLSSLLGGLTYDGGTTGGDIVEASDNTGTTPGLSPRSYTVSGDGMALDTPGGGPSGRLLFSGVGQAKLDLGPSPDTVRITPAPVTTFTLDGGDPATSPGDRLEVDLGGATHPRWFINGGSAVFSFDGRADIVYRNFESTNDFIPPRAVEMGYDAAAGAVTVRFSEDVSGTVDASDLELVSLATGQSYRPASATFTAGGLNTASYVFDALPTGNYNAIIPAAEIADAAGNHPENDQGGFFTVAGIVARRLFYNHSAFDGGDAAATPADDGAIATDKAAWSAGAPVTPANYTSYSRGINGLMIDVAGLSHTGPEDFEFRAGTAGDPAEWPIVSPDMSLRLGAGPGQTDRIVFTWPDGTLVNTWLRVLIPSNVNLGVAAPDVFYFGNLVGETGDVRTPRRVTALDLAAVRRALSTTSSVTATTDFNRDGRTNALDLAVVRRALNQVLPLPVVPTRSADSLSVFSLAEDLGLLA